MPDMKTSPCFISGSSLWSCVMFGVVFAARVGRRPLRWCDNASHGVLWGRTRLHYSWKTDIQPISPLSTSSLFFFPSILPPVLRGHLEDAVVTDPHRRLRFRSTRQSLTGVQLSAVVSSRWIVRNSNNSGCFQQKPQTKPLSSG